MKQLNNLIKFKDFDKYQIDILQEGLSINKIILDVPLFIRMLEYAKEDAKTDMDLHVVTENILNMSSEGKMLTMSDYDKIVKV